MVDRFARRIPRFARHVRRPRDFAVDAYGQNTKIKPMWNEPVSKRLLWAVIFTLAAPSTALFAAEPVASFVAPPVVQFTQESATPPVAPPPPAPDAPLLGHPTLIGGIPTPPPLSAGELQKSTPVINDQGGRFGPPAPGADMSNVMQGMTQGAVQGMDRAGMPNGMMNGMMNGMANGAMNGMPNGMPSGVMNGMMNGMTNGAVNGMMNGTMNGIPNGMMNGITNGMIQGMMGVPNMNPPTPGSGPRGPGMMGPGMGPTPGSMGMGPGMMGRPEFMGMPPGVSGVRPEDSGHMKLGESVPAEQHQDTNREAEMEQQQKRMLEDMKRNTRGMTQGIRMLEREMRVCATAKIEVPSEVAASVATLKDVPTKAQAATDPEVLQDLFADMPDHFDRVREFAESCRRLQELPRITKQIVREITQVEREAKQIVTQAKRAKMDLTDQLNEVTQGISTLRATVTAVAQIRTAEAFEDAMEKLQESRSQLDDLRENVGAMRGVLNISRAITDAGREMTRAERLIASAKRQGKDVAEATEILAECKPHVAELQTIARAKPIDIDAAHDVLQQLEDCGNRADMIFGGASARPSMESQFSRSPNSTQLPDVFRQYSQQFGGGAGGVRAEASASMVGGGGDQGGGLMNGTSLSGRVTR